VILSNTKLISTLITLSPDEWSSFRKHLLMHTRKGSDNFSFFEYLHQRRERLLTIKDADVVREKYFPQMTSKGFSNMMSRLFNWLEDWLGIEEFKNKNYDHDLMLIKSYNRRGLFKLANSKAKELEKRLQNPKGLDLENNKCLAELYHIQYYSENSIKYKEGGELLNKLSKSYINKTKEHLLIYLPELFNIQRIQKYDLNETIKTIKRVIKILPESELSPYLDILLDLNIKNDPKLLNKLFDSVKIGRFNTDGFVHTLIVFYLIALSLQLWVKGKSISPDFIGKIHDYAISSGVLLKNKKMSQSRFHNLVATLSGIKTYNWAMNFIEKNYTLVDCKNIESSKKLAMAQVCFYHKKYDLINGYINSIEFDDFDIKMRSHCLEAVAMYKDKNIDFEILQNKLQNIKRLLSRNKTKVSARYFNSTYNFIDIVSKLSIQKYKEIEIDISSYKDLNFRTWIRNEISELTQYKNKRKD